MKINQNKCTGCKQCIPFCPMGAIKQIDKKCKIDQDICVECYVCLRSNICSKGTFEEVHLTKTRRLRHVFSSPKIVHKTTGISGRGTEEMKTNDVTNRFKLGEVGFTIDVGRPGIGTSFKEIEKITMALAKLGVDFERKNTITKLMSDIELGTMPDYLKKERILSGIIELKTSEEKLILVVDTLKDIAKKIDTVFSVGCIGRVKSNGEIPVKSLLDKNRIYYRPNGKVNIGMAQKEWWLT